MATFGSRTTATFGDQHVSGYSTRSKAKRAPLSSITNDGATARSGGRKAHKIKVRTTPSRPTQEVVDDDYTMMSIDVALMPAGVVDIDADVADPQQCAAYAQDIHGYMMRLEGRWHPNPGYMSTQSHVTPAMRGILIDWLIEVHLRFELLPETLFLTTLVIDRYLSNTPNVERSKLQLVGVTAMLLASKYEEMWPPEIADFVYMTDNAYEKSEIIAMEGKMLATLSFALGNPLPTQFLQRYAKAVGASDMTVSIANYVMELSTTSYEMVSYKPSTLAATALSIASQITGQKCDPVSLEYYSTYNSDQLGPCNRALQTVLKATPDSKLQATQKKFRKQKFGLIGTREDVSRYIASL